MANKVTSQQPDDEHQDEATEQPVISPDFQHVQHAKKRAFLVAYSTKGTVTASARAARCDRTMHSYWLKNDDEYAKAFEEAKESFADSLEEIAFEWVEEMRKNKFKGANPVILAMLLNGHRSEKYRPNQTPTDTTAVDLMAAWRAKAQADAAKAKQTTDFDAERWERRLEQAP